MRPAVVAALVLLLVGCGAWYRPNTTEAQFAQDRYQCEGEAARTYPPLLVVSPGYTTPARTTCNTYGQQTQCVTQPGVTYAGATTDQNEFSRTSYFNSCLRSRGYVWRTN